MTRIYISYARYDRNDGLPRETAIYSWQRAVKLCDGNTETNHAGRCHLTEAHRGNRKASKYRCPRRPIAPVQTRSIST